MSDSNTYLDVWKVMDVSDKKLLMHRFLGQNGDHFSEDEFLKFLARHYEDQQERSKPGSNSKPH